MSKTGRNIFLIILGVIAAIFAVVLGRKWLQKNRQVKGGDKHA